MANSADGKFDNIYKILREHNFQLNVKDKFKCAKCQNILINACVTTCGCRYCRECVDNFLTNGMEKCPGNTAGCKSQHLSNIVPDHPMNIKISKLLVKCPELMCGHECQLIEMEEHIRLCTKKSVQCPCHDLGCHDDDLFVDKINDHLQTDSYKHWTMLMELISDLRNEVRVKDNRIETMRTEMTNKIIKCQVETEMLRGQMQAKDQLIDVMTDDNKLMKVETEMLRRQIDIGKDNLDSKIDAIAAQINGDIESIKMERTELSGELGNLNARLDETRQGCMGHVEEQLGLINGTMGKYQNQMAGRMEKMETWIEKKKDLNTFVWHVDGVSKIWPYDRLGEYFFPKSNPYKIQLTIVNHNSQLQIYLLIHATPNDANLQWPFQANVTVKVTNQATPAACMEATKYFKIPRPSNNNYSSNSRNPFKFPIADLSSKNLLLGDCCIVECLVQLQ